jgi:hypothetical protein
MSGFGNYRQTAQVLDFESEDAAREWRSRPLALP